MPRGARGRTGAALRLGWMMATVTLVETAVCGLAALPSAAAWWLLLSATSGAPLARVAGASLLAVPSYALFAFCLMGTSAAAVRLLGWRTPSGAAMPLAEVGWDLVAWCRLMVVTHVTRVLAGSLYRSSPVWTAYLRLAGARIGRRVYVNSLWLSDYNLLEFADDVVVGGEVHLSGHTVEDGVVKTAPVRVGRGVTIGLGSIIDIGVEIGDGCRVAAHSIVPKHARLEPGATYAGAPVRRVDHPDAAGLAAGAR